MGSAFEYTPAFSQARNCGPRHRETPLEDLSAYALRSIYDLIDNSISPRT